MTGHQRGGAWGGGAPHQLEWVGGGSRGENLERLCRELVNTVVYVVKYRMSSNSGQLEEYDLVPQLPTVTMFFAGLKILVGHGFHGIMI